MHAAPMILNVLICS